MTENNVYKLNETAPLFGAPPLSTTLSSRIVMSVREALFNGSLRPGDMLGTEADLTRQFGVSRIAARDAMKRLEASGIVEIRAGAGGGARIASGNPQLFADALAIQVKLMDASVAEILDTQRGIETMTAELATQNATAEDLQRIGDLIDDAESKKDDVAAFTRSTFAFHLAIAEAAHNKVLRVQLISLQHVAWPSQNRTLTRDVANHVLDLHREIYVVLQSRDAEAAREIMDRHLRQIKARRVAESGELIDSPQVCC